MSHDRLAPLVLQAAALLAAAPASAQQPVPDGLSFGQALGFEIGDLLDHARENARSRGESLECRTPDIPEVPNTGHCYAATLAVRERPTPDDSLFAALLSGQSLLPPYNLLMDGDTVGAIGVQLANLPDVTRASVEAHFDRLGSRAVQGSSERGLRNEVVIWVDAGELDYAMLECRATADGERCTLLLGRSGSPETMRLWLERWRARYPDPPTPRTPVPDRGGADEPS